MTQNRCRAKNPSTCSVHGEPVKSVNTMLENRDFSSYSEFRANLDNKVNQAQAALEEAKFRLAQTEIEIEGNKIRAEMRKTGRDQFNEQEWSVIKKTDWVTVAERKRVAISRLGGATKRDDADFDTFLKVQSGNSKIHNLSEERQVKIYQEQLNTLEIPPGKIFSDKDLYEKHHAAKEDIRKAKQRIALETKIRDEAVGTPSIPVTDGYKALQRYLPKNQQKAFENYNYDLNKILNNNKLDQSHKREALKQLKAATLDNLETALYKAERTSTVSPSNKSYAEEINDAEHFLKTFKSAPLEAIFHK